MADIIDNLGAGLDIRDFNAGSDYVSVTQSGTSIAVSGGDMGENVKSVDWLSLGSVNKIYNDTGSEFLSQDIDVSNARHLTFVYQLMKSGTPLDFQWFLEFKGAGGSYFPYNRDFWGANIYDDAAAQNPPGILVADDADMIGGSLIRFRGLARTVSSTNFFIVSGAQVYLRN